MLHTHLYQAAFKKSPVVFGALPSLHAATAMCCSLYVARYGGRWGHGVMFVYYSAMLWSTQYLHHHWAIDLFLGSALSLGAFTIATKALRSLETKHEQEATTRGVDRLFCWPSPHAHRYESLPTFHENVVFEHSEGNHDGEDEVAWAKKQQRRQRSASKLGEAWHDVESRGEKSEWLELKDGLAASPSSASTDSLTLYSPSSSSGSSNGGGGSGESSRRTSTR